MRSREPNRRPIGEQRSSNVEDSPSRVWSILRLPLRHYPYMAVFLGLEIGMYVVLTGKRPKIFGNGWVVTPFIRRSPRASSGTYCTHHLHWSSVRRSSMWPAAAEIAVLRPTPALHGLTF